MTLNNEQVNQFMRDGYILVREAFPRSLAESIVPLAFAASPFDLADPGTWDRELTVVERSLSGSLFDGLHTPKVLGAIDDLLGAGRYQTPAGTGYLVLNMPGLTQPPWRLLVEHIDGEHFQHHLDSPDQGLILLFMYTDLKPEGGGTGIRVGSHRHTARILGEAGPEGLSCLELRERLSVDCQHLPIIEATGDAGDMLIMHPFTLHASSTNLSAVPRVASNMCVALHEKMDFHRPDPTDQSPVERAIIDSLAMALSGNRAN